MVMVVEAYEAPPPLPAPSVPLPPNPPYKYMGTLLQRGKGGKKRGGTKDTSTRNTRAPVALSPSPPSPPFPFLVFDHFPPLLSSIRARVAVCPLPCLLSFSPLCLCSSFSLFSFVRSVGRSVGWLVVVVVVLTSLPYCRCCSFPKNKMKLGPVQRFLNIDRSIGDRGNYQRERKKDGPNPTPRHAPYARPLHQSEPTPPSCPLSLYLSQRTPSPLSSWIAQPVLCESAFCL